MKAYSLLITQAFLYATIFNLALWGEFSWPLAFVGYALYLIYIFKRKPTKVEATVKLALFSFCFYFLNKVLILRGLLTAINAQMGNSTKGVLAFFMYCFLLSLPALIWGPLISRIFYSKLKKWQIIPCIIVVLLTANYLSIDFFPSSHELFLMANKFFLSSLGILGSIPMKIFFFLVVTLVAFSVTNPKYRLRLSLAACALITVVLIIGLVRLNRGTKYFSDTRTIFLIQTGISNFTPLAKVNLSVIAAEINKKIAQGDGSQKTPIIFFPEYTFEETDKNIAKIKEFQNSIKVPVHLVIGMFSKSEKGYTNDVLAFNEKSEIVGRSGKTILFPIGERPIDFPFIPKSWTRPVVPVIADKEPSLIYFSDSIFMPMICYEGAVPDLYEKLLSLSGNSTIPKYFLNVSKDSYLENTSSLPYLSLFVRAQASLNSTMTLRLSTNGNTEVISEKGEVLARTKSNGFEILRYELGKNVQRVANRGFQ